MTRFYILIVTLFVTFSSFSQGGNEIKGNIKDATTGETIIGASVMYAEGKGAVTDINGNFSIKLDSSGTYNLTISYVGYETQKQKVKVAGKPVFLSFSLATTTLNEVEVVADVARTRETPVAFSNVSQQQIEEELGARDLPLVLNSTPGVYATEQGGGTGDSRINLRGFEQNNIAVMVDGVPMNDMENGQVYWSDWLGLKDITSTIQVQRGLGASKLAIPSVGGTINVITKGIDQKMSAGIKEEVTDYGLYKTTFGYNTGQLKGGWGATVGGSREYGTGWADGTYANAWSYFAKVQKRFKKHLISISTNGAPQSHGVRYDYLPVAIYSKSFADHLGINTEQAYASSIYTNPGIGERGMKFNPDWGTITGDALINGNEGTSQGKPGFLSKPNSGNIFNEYVNYYNKPLFNISHFWNPNEKLTVSTVAYLSIGKGGQTGLKVSAPTLQTTTGLINAQQEYDDNAASFSTIYSTTEHAATNYLRMNNNNHFWYGGLSTWNYKATKNLNLMFGLDGRYYYGEHYQSVYNLMGADYALDSKNYNQPVGLSMGDPNLQYAMKREGDKVNYDYASKIYWGGLFAQAEYKKEKWSAFITASISDKAYQRVDYFAKKDLEIPGNYLPQIVGWGDELYYNNNQYLIASARNGTHATVRGDTTFVGSKYIVNATKYDINSPQAKNSSTNMLWYLGYTGKAGANYNINDHQRVFVNVGYMNMAPPFNNVFDNYNHLYANIKNQFVYSAEGGYGLKYRSVAANVNVYYTIWDNKPFTGYTSTENLYYNVPGLNALHKGVELDVKYQIIKNLEFDGIVSLGDWITTSASTVYITDASGKVLQTIDFSAKNVHVGNAAQDQLSGALRYTIIKGLYIKPRFTYFAKNYANFNPATLVGTNKDHESWKMPNYGLLDFVVGYGMKVWKMKFDFTIGVINVLNTIYISDAQNNYFSMQNYDAASAGVFMGMGRRINTSLRVSF